MCTIKEKWLLLFLNLIIKGYHQPRDYTRYVCEVRASTILQRTGPGGACACMCTSTCVHVCTHTHIHSHGYVQYAHSCSHFLFFGQCLAIPRTSQVALNDSTSLTRSLNCSTEGLSSGCPHLNTFSFFKDMLLNPISDTAIFTRFPSLLNQLHFFLFAFSPHISCS